MGLFWLQVQLFSFGSELINMQIVYSIYKCFLKATYYYNVAGVTCEKLALE